MVSPNDIAGSYTVVSFANTTGDFSGVEVTLKAAGSHKVEFFAHVVNTMRGTLNLKNSVLKGMLIGTLMWGPEYLMELETFLGEGSSDGIKVSISGNVLKLEYGDKTLVLKKA